MNPNLKGSPTHNPAIAPRCEHNARAYQQWALEEPLKSEFLNTLGYLRTK